jgi:hypothetical protein
MLFDTLCCKFGNADILDSKCGGRGGLVFFYFFQKFIAKYQFNTCQTVCWVRDKKQLAKSCLTSQAMLSGLCWVFCRLRRVLLALGKLGESGSATWVGSGVARGEPHVPWRGERRRPELPWINLRWIRDAQHDHAVAPANQRQRRKWAGQRRWGAGREDGSAMVEQHPRDI